MQNSGCQGLTCACSRLAKARCCWRPKSRLPSSCAKACNSTWWRHGRSDLVSMIGCVGSDKRKMATFICRPAKLLPAPQAGPALTHTHTNPDSTAKSPLHVPAACWPKPTAAGAPKTLAGLAGVPNGAAAAPAAVAACPKGLAAAAGLPELAPKAPKDEVAGALCRNTETTRDNSCEMPSLEGSAGTME